MSQNPEQNNDSSHDEDDEKAITTEHVNDTPGGDIVDSEESEEQPLISSNKSKQQTNTQTINTDNDPVIRDDNSTSRGHELNEDFEGKQKSPQKISDTLVKCGCANDVEYTIHAVSCNVCGELNPFYDGNSDTEEDHKAHKKSKNKDPRCSKCVIL